MRMSVDPAARPQMEGGFDDVGPEVLRQIEWPAWQRVEIFSESEKTTKSDPNGRRLVIGFKITDGPAKGYKVWEGLNVVNRSEQARKIAWEQLGELMLACGVAKNADSRVLVGKKCEMRCVLGEWQGEPRLEGTAWRAVGAKPNGASANAYLEASAGTAARPDPTGPDPDDDLPF